MSAAPTPSLIDQLIRHAATRGDTLAFVYLPASGPPIELSWAELDARVRKVAGRLAEAGVAPGEIVLVLSPSPYAQALAFLGAMAAGALPAIVSFPSVKQSTERFFNMLWPLARGAGARWIVSSPDLADITRGGALPVDVLELPSDEALARASIPAELPPPAPGFLQFSSGTTGLRKCVRITSEMLASQAEAYAAALRLEPGDRVASWLPLYHDMGLVAAFLVPLFHGCLSVQLSPFDWLGAPSLLLRAVARYRATLAWLPNFAYQLLASRVSDEELRDVELGSLRALINCSEPVREAAHESFLARFAQVGVRPEQLQACYAMAEATFAVTQTDPGAPARVDRVDAAVFTTRHRAEPAAVGAASMAFVSCGRPIADTEVRILGAEDANGERVVGEIAVRSPSVVRGYGTDSGDRPDSFTTDGWFCTGDLGYLAGGELYLTGRAKDLIIHRGANIYPGDIEEIIGAVPGVKPGRVVVFGVRDETAGTEEIVAMFEAGADMGDERAVVRRVRAEVWAGSGIALADVCLCREGSLLKSTSGKLSRGANRARYLEAGPARAGARPRPATAKPYVAPRDLWERQLAWIWEEVLGVAPVGLWDDVFLDLAADSLAAMRAVAEIQHRLMRSIDASALLGAETVELQAALLRRGEGRAGESLVTLQRRGNGHPLFLAHAAGGWAFPYVTLARHLGEDRPIHAFQAPELVRGDVAAMSVEGLATRYLAAMRAVQPRGPYHLAGWSFGGLIAFEMANRLVAAGEHVARVIVFDSSPPLPASARARTRAVQALTAGLFRLSLRLPILEERVPRLRRLCTLSPLWRFFVAFHQTADDAPLGPLLAFAFGDRFDPRRIEGTSADVAWDYLVALANERPTPEDQLLLIPGLDGAAARRALRVSKKLEQLNVRYATRKVYPGTMDVFAVRDNPAVEGWRAYASGPVVVHRFDIRKRLIGPHWDMMGDENVQLFAPALRQLLEPP